MTFLLIALKIKINTKVSSNHKKHSTVKVFIVCSPLGAVIYLSTAWGDRASDVEIVYASDLFPPNITNQLLADSGFTMVEEYDVTCGAELLIQFFTKRKKQLSPKDVEVSRNISTIRIHIERVIGLYKKIMQGQLSIKLIKSQKDEAKKQSNLESIVKQVHVCAALVNMTHEIVYNDKQ